jgi:hypothetical protein
VRTLAASIFHFYPYRTDLPRSRALHLDPRASHSPLFITGIKHGLIAVAKKLTTHINSSSHFPMCTEPILIILGTSTSSLTTIKVSHALRGDNVRVNYQEKVHD